MKAQSRAKRACVEHLSEVINLPKHTRTLARIATPKREALDTRSSAVAHKYKSQTCGIFNILLIRCGCGCGCRSACQLAVSQGQLTGNAKGNYCHSAS